jgi:cell division protein FtsQ
MRSATVTRRRLVAGAAVLATLFAGYMLWLRDSSLFAVRELEVNGVTANRDEVTAALAEAAAQMTTLHVDDDELRSAVERFPTVASIEANATLFHRLEINVTERLPVAKAKIDGKTVAVSADGYVLTGLAFGASELPSIEADSGPGDHLDEPGAAEAAIVGAVPEQLNGRLQRAEWDEERGGVVVDLDGAPELRFGDGSDAEEKWEAVSAVVADPGFDGAAYLDVSVPERPVSA